MLMKEGSMSYQVPILSSTNYPVWAVKVKAIMDAHGIWETVESRTLDGELHRSKTSVGWFEDTVFGCGSRRELEGLRMKADETVDDFVTELLGLASKAMSLGYELEEADLVKMLLDSMPKSFLQIVASIEQCFELDSMLFDEAVGRLKAYEEHIKGIEKTESVQGGLLLASRENSNICKQCRSGGSNRDDFGNDRGRGRGSGKSRDGNGRSQNDKSHIKCYKCGEFGHYSNECSKWEKEEANLIDDESTFV
ncbi:hypothetical protein LXL04_032118 [Taraxacum kok-saghyz]